jgi:hypothetical protein
MRRRSALTLLLAAAVVAAAGACAARAPAVPTTHPASPSAPSGRLAGAPASLRPGVVVYPDVPAMRAPSAESHHHHAP